MKVILFAVFLSISGFSSNLPVQSPDGGNSAGTFYLKGGKKKVLEKKGVLELVVQRKDGHAGRVTVTVETESGKAEAGKDFTPLSQTVVFEDGDHTPRVVSVELLDDGSLEGPEHFRVFLKDPTGGAVLGGKTDFTATILSPLFSNDAVVLGLLFILLAGVFITSHSDSPFWKKFYKYIPALLCCYFLPSVLGTLNIISGESSSLYFVSSRYLLPACLVLLCLSMDLKGILRLGPKAIIMFLTGTIGIVIGGPIAILIMSFINPDIVGGAGPDAVWRGMTTVAGSWIGGGANQAAMKEVFEVGDTIFSSMIAVDVIVANIWMAVLLFMAGESDKFDARLKADNSAIVALQKKIEAYQASIAKMPTLTDVIKICAVGFSITAVAHVVADNLPGFINSIDTEDGLFKRMSLTSSFFWLIVTATLGGLILSFTRLRELEGAGASRIGSAFLYVLIASIGMKMNLAAVKDAPGLFLVGLIWMSIHSILLLVVARAIKAPTFFLAVGSQANVGGAASAPVVASAFHPTLAPVGVLLAVAGYVVGTFAAWICGLLMQAVAG